MLALFQSRGSFLARLLQLGLSLPLASAAVHAQMHHVDAPERVTRALGVYEWTGDLNKPTAARFVPVSLFINGTMQDAGLYLARPVPFALGTGDVYSLEHAGEPQGLLDLEFAQHVVTNQADKESDPGSAWYGYGKFTPQAPVREAHLRPSTRLAVIQADGKPAPSTDDGRPQMSRRSNSTASAPTTGGDGKQPETSDSSKTGNTGGSSGSTTPSGNGSSGSGSTADSDDADRPTLRHRDPSQDASRRREYGTRSKQASVTAVGPGPGDDPDRPVLGRNTEADTGTPPLTGLPADMHQTVGISDPVHRDAHNFARDWDTPAERTLTQASLEAAARSRTLAYLAANHLVASATPLPPKGVAVSTPATASANTAADTPKVAAADPDESGAPPKLQRGVPSQYQPPVPSSPAANAAGVSPRAPATPMVPVPKAPSHSAPATTNRAAQHRVPRSGTALPATLTLAQANLTGYTLSYGGLPTFVYTAASPVALSRPGLPKSTAPKSTAQTSPAPTPTAPTPGFPNGVPAVPVSGATAHPAVYVTVVAQRLPSGELQVVLASVTDSLHLDRSPRLRLVDAVDPDSSHRASLLFELRGATSRQFALYRLTAAQAEQTFTTAPIE